VKLFGSRAKGTHSRHSDIDLAVLGKVDALQVEALAAELDELPLPNRFRCPVRSISSKAPRYANILSVSA
jgi:predicted nucleotidyltransferase